MGAVGGVNPYIPRAAPAIKKNNEYEILKTRYRPDESLACLKLVSIVHYFVGASQHLLKLRIDHLEVLLLILLGVEGEFLGLHACDLIYVDTVVTSHDDGLATLLRAEDTAEQENIYGLLGDAHVR